jgi:hypothetical protein
MPGPRRSLLSLALGAVCAIALAACGSDDRTGQLPPENASVMRGALEDARAEESEGDCDGVADAAGNLQTEIDELPEDVDPELRDALTQGAENLAQLAQNPDTCEDQQQQTTTTTEEIPTETAPPTTTTEETTTTTEEEPEEDGGPPPQPPGQPPGPPGGGDNNGGSDSGPGGGGEPPTGGTGED